MSTINDVQFWVTLVLTGGGVFAVTFISFWMTLSSRITEAQAMSKANSEKLSSADLARASDRMSMDNVRQSLSRVEVDLTSRVSTLAALTESTAKALTAAENRLAKSIEDIAKSMDHLTSSVTHTLGELAANRMRDRN